MSTYIGFEKDASAGSKTVIYMPPEPSHSAVFVSTGLDIREIQAASYRTQDIEIEGALFRRLTPEYFAWLHSRMVTVQAAHKAGKLLGEGWNTLRQRFNALQELAIREFGKESLLEVLRSFSPKSYSPPVLRPIPKRQSSDIPGKDWMYPGDSTLKFTYPVTAHALSRIDAIRDEAIVKKWSEARLYQNQGRYQFPYGGDYGVVCYVNGDYEIGEITERFIEIVHGTNSCHTKSLKYYNPGVSQPWMEIIKKTTIVTDR